MSLVGTRPPTVDEWEQYELHHRRRMSTKPGITGMWQVSGRSDITDFEEVVRLDTESVGRIENQKAFDRIVGVLKRLDGLKDKINWIVIGNGSQRKMIERQIIQEKLQDSIRFVGPKTNPYPYIANSDLFVLTSIYESQPMVIMEALTIGIPVVSTNFESAYELLENKKYGVICDNSEEGLRDLHLSLLDNRRRNYCLKMKEN